MKRALASSLLQTPKIILLDTFQEQTSLKGNPGVTLGQGYDRSVYLEGRLAVSTTGKIDMVEMAEILFVKAESNYVRIWLKDNVSYMMAKTLKQLRPGLERCGFIRVHQSYIVHPSMIRSYHSSESKIILRSGDQIPVSRVNRKMVTQQLMKWS